MKNRRFTQLSVNNFIHYKDDYLFLLRNADKSVDAGRLNSIGGKVDPGENYLQAVIRETQEETGIVIASNDIKLVGIVNLEGGYKEDWVMCFFKTEVMNKTLPVGNKTNDGELLWINKDKVLNNRYELVDDLYYTFEDVVHENGILFANAQINNNEKVEKYNGIKL